MKIKEKYPEMNYLDTADFLIEKNILKKQRILFYKGKGYAEYYDKVFMFCRDNLNHLQKLDLISERPYFIFLNKDEVYAMAKKKADVYLIGFDEGILKKLDRWFGSYFNISMVKGLEEFETLDKKFDVDLSQLISQSILLFTFYHEYAHLIQFRAETSFEQMELINGDNEEYSEKSHVEEFDADSFSAAVIAMHCGQYIEKADFDSYEDLMKYISLLSGSIAAYIMTLPMPTTKFYVREFQHPHNTIRTLETTIRICHTFEFFLNQKQKIDLRNNFKKILQSSSIVLEKLLIHFDREEILDNYKNHMYNYRAEIKEYSEFLRGKHKIMKNSSLNKWNSSVRR